MGKVLNFNKPTNTVINGSKIKVRAIMDFEVYNHDETELLCKVKSGEEFIAKLSDDSDEYFAKDSEGREVFVGELDVEGNLSLIDEFELIG